MKYNGFRTFLLVALMCSALSACGPGKSGPESLADEFTVLTIGTADSGGTMYPVGSAIAQSITDNNNQIKINVGASSGSLMNVQGLVSGEIDLGLVSGDVAYAALHGIEEFKQPVEGLRAIAAIYSSTSNWIAPTSADINYVHDLDGRILGVGPKDSSTELSAVIALEALGLMQSEIVLDNCSLATGAQKVISGELDALHGFTGTPIVGFTELADTISCRVLRYTEPELSRILSQNKFYYRAVIPAGTYTGQIESIPTFGVKCLLCVDASMDDELVYALTSALWESRQALGEVHPSMASMTDRSFMYENLPIDLHDGAVAFYQEIGALKD